MPTITGRVEVWNFAGWFTTTDKHTLIFIQWTYGNISKASLLWSWSEKTVNFNFICSRLPFRYRYNRSLKCTLHCSQLIGTEFTWCLSFSTSAIRKPDSQFWNSSTCFNVARCTWIAISACNLSGRYLERGHEVRYGDLRSESCLWWHISCKVLVLNIKTD